MPTLVMALVFMYSQPNPRTPFEYAPADPSLLTLYGSHFAHSSLYHLSANMGMLWLVGGTAFLLLCACGRKRLYYYTFGSFLVLLPIVAAPVLHASVLHFRPEQYGTVAGVGSSGILSALVAFLGLATVVYLRDRVVPSLPVLPLGTLLGVSGFVTPAVVRGWAGAIGGAAILALVGSVGYSVWRVYEARTRSTVTGRRLLAALIGGGIFHGYAYWMLAHKDPGMGFDMHLAGYIVGLGLGLCIIGAAELEDGSLSSIRGTETDGLAEWALWGILGLVAGLCALSVIPAVIHLIQ